MPSRPDVHVVLACSERKSLSAERELLARSLSPGSCESRAAEWVRRLAVASGPKRPVLDLYQGEHWSIARRIAARNNVALWVSSAGLGLVAASSEAPSYGCTFASPALDSMVTPEDRRLASAQRRVWWAELQMAQIAGLHRSRLGDLAASAPVIVSASGAYLSGMADEIAEAWRDYGIDRLIVVTAGDLPAALDGGAIRVEGRMRMVLGGSMGSLNARVAAQILDNCEPDELTRAHVADGLQHLSAAAPALVVPLRQPASDDEIAAYIHDALMRNGAVSCTALHRALRDSGRACEQGRFRRLYHNARERAS